MPLKKFNLPKPYTSHNQIKRYLFTTAKYILSSIFYSILLQTSIVNAQLPVSVFDSVLAKYDFIDTSVNEIQNDTMLFSFFTALKQLESNHKGTVSIAHIGDSHIQAGHLTSIIRERLQSKFGNSGRGLIFPYQVAGTNGPSDFSSSSNIKWSSWRNSYNISKQPTGLSGHSLYSTDSSGIITFNIHPIDSNYLPLTRITIFHNSICDSNYCYHITDTTGNSYTYFHPDKNSNDSISEFTLDSSILSFNIVQEKKYDEQRSSMIYGIVLSNGFPGVLYHSIGVNGAEYRTYLRSGKFIGQLASLHSDLLILAMGTNEAYNTGNFKSDSIRFYVNTLIAILRTHCPNAQILISVLPESLKGYRVKRRVQYRINPNINTVRNILIESANKNKLPYWDLYSIMGGNGSMMKWYAAGMTDKRRVHFSSFGYRIQGELFYRALIKSYERFLQKNP